MESRLLLATVLLSTKAVGQGNVRLSNDFIVTGTQKKPIVGVQSGPLSKEFGRVEAVQPWTGIVFKSGGLIADGIFSLGVTDIPGTTPGGYASIYIRAWDTRFGATFESVMGSEYAGWVEVKLVGLGGGAIPPPRLADIGNFRGILNHRLSNVLDLFPAAVNPNGSLRIQASSFVGTGLRIWSSTDLQHWTEAAPLLMATIIPDDPWFGRAEWNLQPSGPVMFYRVAYWWDDWWDLF